MSEGAGAVVAFLAGALREPLPAGRLRIVTVPAPVLAPEELLSLAGPAFFWTTPGAPVHVGLGIAHRLEGSGEDRFRAVRAAADLLWPRLEAVSHDDAAPPTPRIFGGFSFLPGTPSPEWRSFGEATFVLPRLLYTHAGDRATLSVTVTAEEAAGTAVAVGADASGAARASVLDSVVAEAESLLRRPAEAADRGESSHETARSGVRSGPGLDLEGPGEAGGSEGEESARSSWREAVSSIQRRIDEGRAEKIVAARCRSVPLREGLGLPGVLRALDRESATAARFAFRLDGDAFVGATPERLVGRSGRAVRTEALAGSVAADNPEREAALLESLKEEEEHRYVVRAIADALEPLCESLEYPPEPRIQRLLHVLHLQTPFAGRLREGVHVLELVERLHPTPAVGGLPRDEALAWIQGEETGSRGWYAAPIGWFDAAGDGEFGVALRSGLLRGNRALLYAGAGIVRGSDPEAEFEETKVKLRTMLAAVGAGS